MTDCAILRALQAVIDAMPVSVSQLIWALALFTAMSVLLERQGQPTAALSWLLALFALPYLALPAWWLIGRTYLSTSCLQRRRAEEDFTDALTRMQRAPQPAPSDVLPIVHLPLAMRTAVFPECAGNGARLLVDGATAYDAWESAIDNACDNVHLLFYVWNDDRTGRRLRDALRKAVARGVKVRVLYDYIGTGAGQRIFADLVRRGGSARPFMPLRFGLFGPELNFRNHRKLIVVDGVRAFVGGINVGDEYLSWHDLAVEFRGPAVDQAQQVFCDDWFFSTGEDLSESRYFARWSKQEPGGLQTELENDVSCALIAGGPAQRVNATREMLFLVMTQARRRLWIVTPYLIPDPALALALRTARYRGVDVRVLVPERSDVWLARRASRAFYPELTASGVRIFEYPGMVHAKALLIDDHLLGIGSANMDTRSLRLNFEVMCFFASRGLNASLRAVCEQDFAKSRAIERDEIERRRWPTRVVDAAAHLLSPLL